MNDIKRNNQSTTENPICPQCRGLLADMGFDFKSPSKSDLKAWQHLTDLYVVGITFHSCGCTGPGYIPKDKVSLLQHLNKTKEHYIEQLRLWINYIEPKTKKEKELRKQKNDILYPPFILTERGTKKVEKTEVIAYWSQKIEDLDKNINDIKNKI